MKVLVTGVCGQLGHDVVNELTKRGHEAAGSDITPAYSGADDGTAVTRAPYVQMDITDAGAVSHALGEARPDAVIHCAAWTAVDAAEDNEDRVRAINAGGTRHIAAACKVLGCKLMYISTDYVFDGQGETPWAPDCTDYAPLNVYGQTKLEGELAVRELVERFFIVRIAWVFGLNGKNFIKTMLSLGQKHESLRVVDMIETDRYGYYHATNEGGYISWADFAGEIFRQAGMPTKVVPVTTSAYGLSKAARPFNSRLDKRKLIENGFEPLPTWQDALSRYLREIGCTADKT